MKRYGKSLYRIVHDLHYLHFGRQNRGHNAQSANNARIFIIIKNIAS